LLDNRKYEVEYTDGTTEVLVANTITGNLLAQIDDQGKRHLMIDEIEDQRQTAGAVPKERLELALGTEEGEKYKRPEVYVRGKEGSGD
jgi:hypothetical protein